MNILLPQPGDFEVVPMSGDSGKLIHLGQVLNGDGFRNYEHARLYVGNGQCVEARPGGAAMVPWVTDDGGLWSTGKIKLTDSQRDAICKAGKGYIGTPYSAMDYFAISVYRLHMGLLVPGLKTYVASSGHMICSQLVDQCYQDAGVQLFNDGRWPGYVTPAALANLISQA